MPSEEIITQLKVLGQAQYVRAMQGASTSVRDFDRASDKAEATVGTLGKTADRSSKQIDLFGQQSKRAGKRGSMAVATIGRSAEKTGGTFLPILTKGAKTGGLAVGALAGVAAYAGLKLDALREQNQAALSSMLGAPKVAEQLGGALESMARGSEMATLGVQDLYPAARLLIGAKVTKGFRDTSRLVRAMGDAATVAGTGGEGIYSMARAIGQIKGRGFMAAEEVNQITDATQGLIGKQTIANELTDRQRKLLSKGKLPASEGIAALTTAMEKFRPAATKMGDTFSGQLATMGENAKYTAGIVFKPLFDLLGKDVFPWLNKIGMSIQSWAAGGGMKQVGDQAARFFDALKPAAPFLQNVLIPLAQGFGKAFLDAAPSIGKALNVGLKVLGAVSQVLGFIGKQAQPLGAVFRTVGYAIGVAFTLPVHVLKETYRFGKMAIDALPGLATGAVNVAKGAFTGVVDFFEARINDLIGIIDKAIDAYNKIPIAPDIGRIGEVGAKPKGGPRPAMANLGLSGHLAAGGPVIAGHPYEVGERGPELFVPGSSGSIKPNLGGFTVVVQSLLDGRIVAQSTARHNASEMARK